MPRTAGERRDELEALLGPLRAELEAANRAREVLLPACREVIRAASRAIRATHLGEVGRADEFATEAETALRRAQTAGADQPLVFHSGPLHDAEKEYAECRLTAALVAGEALPSAPDLGVSPQSWMRGLGEAASELRRHLLDELRRGGVSRAEDLLEVMDEAYEALFGIDFPDAVTLGLRRTVDQLRAVLERTRGDVTTTVLQERLRAALER